MRSKIVPIALILLALTSGAVAFLHFSQKNLSALFGEPSLLRGELVFQYEPNTVRGIELSSGLRTARYEERQGQWLIKTKTTPDRADYRTLEALLAFSSQLTVLESIPVTEKNKKALGFKPARATLNLKNEKGKSLAEFSLGRKGAWHRHIPAPDAYSQAQDLPTIYVYPAGSESIYLCSSPYLDDVLNNGFGNQRDRRPFFFPPELLAEVSITRPNGTLILARENPSAAWGIEKPFRLEADAEAAAKLVSGLYNLTALSASNKPAPPSQEPDLQIALRFFALNGTIHEVPVTLSLTKPKKENTRHYLGRLDDWRKNVEFLLPSEGLELLFQNQLSQLDSNEDGHISADEKAAALVSRFDADKNGSLDSDEKALEQLATQSLVGIDDLPLDIEQLRGASLSGLDLRQLQTMRITTPELSGPLDIEISRSEISGDWKVERTYEGKTSRANEFTFFKVKKVLSEEKAIATISDSVQDLAQYGLDAPILSITLSLFNGTSERIDFGEVISDEGVPHFYLRRNDSHTVMEVEPPHYYSLAARPYLWREANIWNFTIIDLSLLMIEQPDIEALTLDYSDLTQTWRASLGSEDVTALLNENRANRYLDVLEHLKVDRWLGPDHGPARRALEQPIFKVTAIFQKPDDEAAPIETKTLRLAPSNQGGRNPFYYGQIEGDPHYFTLDLPTVGQLAEPLLEEE